MSKGSGGVRPLATKQIPAREKEYRDLLASGEYGESYFSPAGGFVVAEKTRGSHSEEEWEAAIAMADNGYRVKLKNEDGQGETEDGTIISFGTYEQRTPSGKSDTYQNFAKGMFHARDKNAKIAVIYQMNGKHSRETVSMAIDYFSRKTKYKLSRILVVTKDGRIHTHYQ